MNEAKLKMNDKFTDVYGDWQVLSVHPPQGKRRHVLYTILNTQTSKAEMVQELQLFKEDNKLVIHED